MLQYEPAHCPICEEDLEIDDTIDGDGESDNYLILTVTGTCPTCGKEYQWDIEWEPIKTKNLKEI